MDTQEAVECMEISARRWVGGFRLRYRSGIWSPSANAADDETAGAFDHRGTRCTDNDSVGPGNVQ